MLSDRCLCLSVCDVGVSWRNGWIDQDATWYGGRPRPMRHCVRWDQAPPRKGAQQPPFFGTLCSGMVAHLSWCLTGDLVHLHRFANFCLSLYVLWVKFIDVGHNCTFRSCRLGCRNLNSFNHSTFASHLCCCCIKYISWKSCYKDVSGQ